MKPMQKGSQTARCRFTVSTNRFGIPSPDQFAQQPAAEIVFAGEKVAQPMFVQKKTLCIGPRKSVSMSNTFPSISASRAQVITTVVFPSPGKRTGDGKIFGALLHRHRRAVRSRSPETPKN
jgi:hypothetical protein